MRNTSDNPEFPWLDRRVCFFVQSMADARIHSVGIDRESRAEAIRMTDAGDLALYAVWPGQYRSDLFLVDDLTDMAEVYQVTLRHPEEESKDEPEPEGPKETPIVVPKCLAESSPMSKGQVCTFHKGHFGQHSWERG